MTNHSNPSVQCSVNSCAYHSGPDQTCTLQQIKVGCCQNNVCDCKETKCASFKLGTHGTSCT